MTLKTITEGGITHNTTSVLKNNDYDLSFHYFFSALLGACFLNICIYIKSTVFGLKTQLPEGAIVLLQELLRFRPCVHLGSNLILACNRSKVKVQVPLF